MTQPPVTPAEQLLKPLIEALEGCAEHPGLWADDLSWAKTEIAREALAQYRRFAARKAAA